MRSGHLFCLVLSLLVGGTTQSTLAQAHQTGGNRAEGLNAPHQRAWYPQVMVPGNLVNYFDRGYVITRELESAGPDVVNVVLWNTQGARAREARIWFDGAARVWINHAAVSEGGSIIASGGAVTSAGQRARFIARTDLRGTVTHVIRTDAFVPVMVCAAPDGTVWSFGREIIEGRETRAHNMLRRYSFDRGLLAEYLPRSSFDTDVSPAVHFGSEGSYLRCSRDRVAVYVARTHEYIEVHYSDHRPRRWPVDSGWLEGFRVGGFAVTDSGGVYASLSSGRDGNWAGIFELVFDEATGFARWELVPGTFGFDQGERRMRSTYGMVHGADGDSLVVGSTPQGLAWVTPVTSSRPR